MPRNTFTYEVTIDYNRKLLIGMDLTNSVMIPFIISDIKLYDESYPPDNDLNRPEVGYGDDDIYKWITRTHRMLFRWVNGKKFYY